MFFFPQDADTTIKPSMTDLESRTVSVLERLRRRRETWKTGKSGIYPRPRKYPPEYPRPGLAKSPQFQGLTKNIPNIPNIPGVSGMRMDAFECTYLHKETLNFTLLIYIYIYI